MGEPMGEVDFGVIDFGDPLNPRILLVQDADKPSPAYWKLVGGRQESPRDKSPLTGVVSSEETMTNEALEEVGLRIKPIEIFFDKEILKHGKSPHRFLGWRILLDGSREEDIQKGKEVARFKVMDRKQIEAEFAYGTILEQHKAVLIAYFDEYCAR